MFSKLFKTFLRLNQAYYFTNVIFSFLLTGGFFFALFTKGVIFYISPLYLVLMVLNALLFPYSLFIFEIAMQRLVGNRIGATTTSFYNFFKFLSMVFCFVFAFYIAPLGLIYLFVRFSNVPQKKV